MKKLIVLALTLALSLCACAKQQAPAAEPEGETAAEPAVTEQTQQAWDYAITTETETESYTAEDGTELASWSYERPVLTLKNGEGKTRDSVGDGVTEEQLGVCKTFNDAIAKRVEEARAGFEDLKVSALEQYTEMGEEHRDYFGMHTEETVVTNVYRRGDLLEVALSFYGYWGGAHGGATERSLHYDLGEGAFFTLNDLSDDPAALRAAVAEEIIRRIDDEGMADMYFPGYEDTIRGAEDFNVSFSADGVTFIFDQYELAPYAAGMPSFTLDYALLAPYLSERGAALLGAPSEAEVLRDFNEAQEMWGWFRLNTMPLDYDHPASEEGYYPVDYPGVATMSDLRALLLTRFSDELAIGLLAPVDGFEHYKDIDGVLCAVDAGRGSDVTVASVDYAVDLAGGKVIATIWRQDFDESSETLKPTGESDTAEFPYVWAESGARFSAFPAIW